MMVVVVTMMMVRLRKCGSRNHQDHGKKQSLFHVNIIATKDRRIARLEYLSGYTSLPNDVTPPSGEIFERVDYGVATLVPGAEEEDQGDE
jgi:hypothetical protein